MKIKVHGAAEEVTGSCIQITTEHSNIIVDCGLIQGAPKKKNVIVPPSLFHYVSLMLLS